VHLAAGWRGDTVVDGHAGEPVKRAVDGSRGIAAEGCSSAMDMSASIRDTIGPPGSV
jgi:hypothetical protein